MSGPRFRRPGRGRRGRPCAGRAGALRVEPAPCAWTGLVLAATAVPLFPVTGELLVAAAAVCGAVALARGEGATRGLAILLAAGAA